MAKWLVIGGGIAGLTAAYTASARGEAVTLIDPRALGGVIRTKREQSFQLDCGPNVLLTKPALMRLIGDLELGSSIVRPRVAGYAQYVWHDGRFVKVPKSPRALLASPLIPVHEKLTLAVHALKSLEVKGNDESAGIFFERLIGPCAVRSVMAPVVRGIWGGDIYSLSTRSNFPALWQKATRSESLLGGIRRNPRPKTFVLRRGCGELVERLIAKMAPAVSIQQAEARSIEPVSTGYRVKCADGREFLADKVILATAARATSELLSSLLPHLSAAIETVTHASIAVVHVAALSRVRALEDSFGVLFPAGRADQLIGVMATSELFPHVAPQGRQLLTLSFGGVTSGDAMSRSDSELAEMASAVVRTTLSAKDVSPLSVTKWRDALPQYGVGHWELDEMLTRLETALPGVAYAGVLRGGMGIADRVAVAADAVHRLCDGMGCHTGKRKISERSVG